MHRTTCAISAAIALVACGCHKNKTDDSVVSQTYVHKYGYAVSEQEWNEKNYPGQVITSLKNGVTITATYEDGTLHGPYTVTYPHSQMVEKYILYNQNIPVKEIFYDRTGMPLRETTQLSQNRYSQTSWYTDGVPCSIEEYAGEKLLEGQYFTIAHQMEAKVEQGEGTRTMRDTNGILTCKDQISDGMIVKRETFYLNGSPESIAFYMDNKLHGTKKTFTNTGEPISVEDWAHGHLHGLSTYYKNGTREIEVYYLYGKKHGLETHFLDGKSIMRQITWEQGRKHGPETFYLPNEQKVVWNYDGKEVSQVRFEELSRLDAIIGGDTL